MHYPLETAKSPNLVRRKADAVEMLALFDERHYKSCTMMACSLIEGETLNLKISRANTRVVTSKPRGLVTTDNIDNARIAAINLIGIVGAYDYFFRNAKHFDRSIEGELNRNFLMHGMMYKSISQIACIKLFILIDRVVKLLPSCHFAYINQQ
ncbi:MAG: hypothetical protein DUD39_07745 [Coriobacteriaceae bacterium]|nr:MAG: hypothetical protein DUD39_07745 [Coriobacteriaceae bacterium]